MHNSGCLILFLPNRSSIKGMINADAAIEPNIYHISTMLSKIKTITNDIIIVAISPILVLEYFEWYFLLIMSLPIVMADTNLKLSIVDITIEINDI